MNTEKLKEQLSEKIQKEYDDFIENLKLLPPEHIVESSYEKVFKEKFMTTVQYKDFSKQEIKALLKMDYPLDSLYQEWLKNDLSYIPFIEDTVDDHIKKAMKQQKKDLSEH